MKKDVLLMVGPTAIPERVLKVMNTQIMSHRSGEFAEIARELGGNLKKVFQTDNEVMTLTGSGTSSMEAVVQNCFSPGDQVVVAVLGVFSERMAAMCESYGLNVRRVVSTLGQAADVDAVMSCVNKDTKGVFVVHNESATGVYNHIEPFGRALCDTDALLVVDSVSGMGGIDLKMDSWHVDVAFTASQKALMGPPGLSFISLSHKAWAACDRSTAHRYYFDLQAARRMNLDGQHPWTPGVYQVLGANEALRMIMEEGLSNVYSRHDKLSRMVTDGMERLGIGLFPKDAKYASKTVNTFAFDRSPEFVKALKEDYGVVISGGQDSLSKTTFRVGTMGYVAETDVAAYLYAAEQVLKKL